MKPPIRLVCGDCLRSVELYEDEPRNLPTACPFCGGTIDSQSTDTLPEPPPGGMTPWVETWSRGTLGTIGRFQLRERLGDGGFGQVYLAYDPRLDRDVALKVLKPSDLGERAMARFFREARAAARLDHPNIVAVYDAGHDAGRCWIAYQYVNGRTLLHQRDQQPFDLITSVRIILELADALGHAHRHGVFHRDLKPTNVIIDEQGRPRLTDFGLARRADFESDLTRDGAILGTPAYMSPEQASGRSHQADERSDVYSLGVIFFELLCGRRPANLPSAAPAWMAKPKPGSPRPSPRSIDHTIPPALDRICRKALASDPAQRYPNTRSLADDLNAWLRRPQGAWLRRPQGAMRPLHSLACPVLGIAAALLLMVGLKALFAPGDSPRPPVAAPVAPPAPKSEPPAAAPKAPVAPPDPHETLVFNRRSKTYHRADCPTLTKGLEENFKPLRDAEQAVKRGFRPCSVCSPPISQSQGTTGAVPGSP